MEAKNTASAVWVYVLCGDYRSNREHQNNFNKILENPDRDLDDSNSLRVTSRRN